MRTYETAPFYIPIQLLLSFAQVSLQARPRAPTRGNGVARDKSLLRTTTRLNDKKQTAQLQESLPSRLKVSGQSPREGEQRQLPMEQRSCNGRWDLAPNVGLQLPIPGASLELKPWQPFRKLYRARKWLENSSVLVASSDTSSSVLSRSPHAKKWFDVFSSLSKTIFLLLMRWRKPEPLTFLIKFGQF